MIFWLYEVWRQDKERYNVTKMAITIPLSGSFMIKNPQRWANSLLAMRN